MTRTSVDDRDLRSLERAVNRNRWSNGLLDTAVGLSIILIGVMWLVDLVAVGAAVPLVVISLWSLARRRLIEPRTGYAKPGREREQVERKSLSMAVVLGIILMMQVVLFMMVEPLADGFIANLSSMLAPAIPASLLALLVFLGGIMLDQRRGVTYAFLLLNVGIAGALLNMHPGTIMVVAGGVILAVGSVMLHRFLNANPAPAA